MRRVLLVLLALATDANGLAMLFAGRWWYGAVPGAAGTGPFNAHFVEDVGAAYVVTGAGFAWLAARPSGTAPGGTAPSGTAPSGTAPWGAALAGAAFLAIHAAIHVAEAIGGAAGPADLVRDFPGVILPALVGLFVIWPRAHNSET